MLENSQMHKRMQLLAKVHYRSEGFPRTRLFHPWARWGEGWRWLGIVPCRCRATGRVGVMGVGMRGVGGDARGVGMHQTIRVASDNKSSIGLSE